MYYKFTDSSTAIYKALHAFRTKEHEIAISNVNAIKERFGSDFSKFYGHAGQLLHDRVPKYIGFDFTEPDKIDAKAWSKTAEGWMPNARTKKGRENRDFLRKLPSSCVWSLFELLGIELMGKYTYPFLEICGEVIILRIHKELAIEGAVEITSIEFHQIYRDWTLPTAKNAIL